MYLRLRKLIGHLWVALLNLRYRRRPYHEYYTAAMKVRSWVDPQYAIGGKWDEVGRLQFDYLTSIGLKPGHRLLDFGCGALRGGLRYIDYLEKGNYEGIDISPEALENGRVFLKKAGLDAKEPRLHLSTGMTFEEFEGRTFDYIIAQSVLTHMPLEDIDHLLANISKVMTAETKFCATFFDGGTRMYTTQNRLNFHFPVDRLVSLAQTHGLRAVVDPTYEHPRGQSMLLFTLESP